MGHLFIHRPMEWTRAMPRTLTRNYIHTRMYLATAWMFTRTGEAKKGTNSSVFYTFLRAWVGTWAWIIGVSTVVASEV
jgi:hypothetical protein